MILETPTSNVLCTLEEARAKIASGLTLVVAGDERLLDQLPRGQWIGGTIPYFMADTGGCLSTDHVLVTEMPEPAGMVRTALYDEAALPRLAADGPDNGLTLTIIPASTAVHYRFAQDAPGYQDMFLKPVVGWIAGVALADLGKVTPKVYDGRTGRKSDCEAVALHLPLPAGTFAHLEMVNLFVQGDGDDLTFPANGFEVRECRVNGELRNFAEYLTEHGTDTRLPLVADYHGAMINVSFQSVDADTGLVTLYAPVFEHETYRIASPVGDYASAFATAIPSELHPIFACNCILNYLYGELEGKRTGSVGGPFTFGEIAYQLVNQTLVYCVLETPSA